MVGGVSVLCRKSLWSTNHALPTLSFCKFWIRQSSDVIPGSSNSTVSYKEPSEKKMMYETDSPYKQPGPRRYGYVKNYKTQGVLPRNDRPVRSLPPYKPYNLWTEEKAHFGQNDYIDILGDGDIHPSDLIKGPRWLIAFQGNERDRLMRRMEWEGARLKTFYPSEWERIDKRIRFLTKRMNTRRPYRWYD